MRIKNKTLLRREVKRRLGTTGELDKVFFSNDGKWGTYSSNTTAPDAAGASFGSLAEPPEEYGWTVDQAITYNLSRLEQLIDEMERESRKRRF